MNSIDKVGLQGQGSESPIVSRDLCVMWLQQWEGRVGSGWS